MTPVDYDVAIVGAGPGGYVAAIRAAQRGLRTVLVDRSRAGGTCLNIGCIPSKAVIHAAEQFHAIAAGKDLARLGISAPAPTIDLAATMSWKDGVVDTLSRGVAHLVTTAGAELLSGDARVVDGKELTVTTAEGQRRIKTANLVIASGSVPFELPSLPFGGKVISSTGALALTSVPPRLVVVGAGYIGLELGTAFAKLGAQVTFVEVADRILPQYDAELSRPVARRLRDLGVTSMLGAKAGGLAGDGVEVIAADGERHEVPADAILVAVGRRPALDGWGVESLDLDRNGPFLAVDDRCETSMRGVFAIGDVTGEPMLAHRAMAQGDVVAAVIAGERRSFDAAAIPAVCFTDPEIISIGLAPAEAGPADRVLTGTFPFSASGRALTLGRRDGFVRVVARRSDHLLLGVQAVGPGVSELSAACTLAIEMGATLEDVAATIHAHPTLTEAVQEAALAALGNGLHGG
jgi:dihydrolipoamide dehydrogenase